MFFNSMFQIRYTKTEILVNIITVHKIPSGVSGGGDKAIITN